MVDTIIKKIYENDEVIVWDYAIQPGQSTGVHTHKLDYTFIVTNPGRLQEFDRDGNETLPPTQFHVGDTYHLIVSKDGTMLREKDGQIGEHPATHNGHNVGDTVYKEILIEYKKKLVDG